MPRRKRASRHILVTLIAVAVLGIVVAVWIVDALTQSGSVGHNVSLEGTDLSGTGPSDLSRRLTALANRFEAIPVVITAGSATYHTTEGALGVTVDTTDASTRAMHARRGSLVTALPRWIDSLFATTNLHVHLHVDETALRAAAARLTSGPDAIPAEPSFDVRDGKVVIVGGRPGTGVDPHDVEQALVTRGYTLGTVTIAVPPRPVSPHTTIDQAQQVADAVNALTASGIQVSAGSATTTLTSLELRHWIVASGQGPAFAWAFDHDLVSSDLAKLLAAGTSAPTDAYMTLDANHVPQVVPSVDGAACCAPEAPAAIAAALKNPLPTPLALPLRTVPANVTTAQLLQMGIKEVVSSFTTHHPCCADRVLNIHRAADLVRGVVLRPGQSLSLNDFLGERTPEKGWLNAPTIIDGKLEQSAGGGISQFMTTIFNAAWFAGLDFDTYQSHSIYISRYPFGREATISWPAPDLQIRDSTPYGVMIWPTYTDTSITITIYSTHYLAKVEQGSQTATLSGKSCSSITTPRTRTYLDGTVKTDVFYARYQAREGVLCNDPLPPGVSPVAVPGQPPPTAPPATASAPTTVTATTIHH